MMNPKAALSLFVAPLLATAGLVHADLTGLDPDPFSNSPTWGPSYAYWDTFPARTGSPMTPFSFSNAAPNSSSFSLSGATLSLNMSGGSTPNSGQRIYQGVAAGNAAFNLTIGGTVSPFKSIDSLVVQIRFTEPDGYDFDDFFTLTLTTGSGSVSVGGVATITSGIGTQGTPPTEQNYGIVEWRWTDLGLKAGDAYSISITSPAAGHASIDAISINAVPEPSSWVLLLAGFGFIVWLKRHRRASQNPA